MCQLFKYPCVVYNCYVLRFQAMMELENGKTSSLFTDSPLFTVLTGAIKKSFNQLNEIFSNTEYSIKSTFSRVDDKTLSATRHCWKHCSG
jgi:hypothetical protein